MLYKEEKSILPEEEEGRRWLSGGNVERSENTVMVVER